MCESNESVSPVAATRTGFCLTRPILNTTIHIWSTMRAVAGLVTVAADGYRCWWWWIRLARGTIAVWSRSNVRRKIEIPRCWRTDRCRFHVLDDSTDRKLRSRRCVRTATADGKTMTIGCGSSRVRTGTGKTENANGPNRCRRRVTRYAWSNRERCRYFRRGGDAGECVNSESGAATSTECARPRLVWTRMCAASSACSRATDRARAPRLSRGGRGTAGHRLPLARGHARAKFFFYFHARRFFPSFFLLLLLLYCYSSFLVASSGPFSLAYIFPREQNLQIIYIIIISDGYNI